MTANPEIQLIEDVAAFTHDPVGFMQYAYPWGEAGELEQESGPRTWQSDINKVIGEHLQNPKTRHMPLLIGVASGHGIGKSAEIGMVSNWGMSTCEDCKLVVTANTENQLRTKTWPEISKWFRLSITSHWFERTATSIYSVDPKHADSWRANAVTWSVNNTEAFAGLHNKRKRIMVIFDEASAIADKVWEVTEGALTDEDTEIIWICFGNFTRATGRFADIFGKNRHRWVHRQIDSRTVEGTNKEQIKKWEEDHGVDSDFFKVRVRGMPPSSSNLQFISTADVDKAFGKHLRPEEFNWAPKIISLDPAWEGDDELVIGIRQGLSFRVLSRLAKNDNDVEIANLLARLEDQEGADAVFIDMGYGTGIYSVGKSLGRNWRMVNFAEKSTDPGCLNKRAQMWKEMRDWLKEGGSIPPLPELHAELIGPETVGRTDGKLQIESKKSMKERGQASPNIADALAITFAYPVANKQHVYQSSGKTMLSEYDPFRES